MRLELADSTRIAKKVGNDFNLEHTYNCKDPALSEKMIGESELKYLHNLLKGNSEKWES